MTTKHISKIIAFFISFLLIFEQSGFAQVAVQINAAGYLSKLNQGFVQDKFRPLHLRYLSFNQKNDAFSFQLDKGDFFTASSLRTAVGAEAIFKSEIASLPKAPRNDQQILRLETQKLMRYFLIGLALPNESFWVNLRPDGEDNIIDNALAKTDIGRIMLEADVELKKDTAKLTSPETPQGKAYWDKLYKKAGELFGNENITIPTLTRPWIVPSEIIIRENKASAYIYKATLKVCLEQDYLKNSDTYSFKDPRLKALNEYSSELIRELIIPKLNKEVNSSKRYSELRQVYYSLIMAQWFKARFRSQSSAISSQISAISHQSSAIQLIDRKILTNLTSKTRWSKTTYFKEYKKSFKDGEYNIKEPIQTLQGQSIRSYFSGGIQINPVVPEVGAVVPANIEAMTVLVTKNAVLPNSNLTPLQVIEVAEQGELSVIDSSTNHLTLILNDLEHLLISRGIVNVKIIELEKLAQRIYDAQFAAGGSEIITVNLEDINIPGITQKDARMLGTMGMGAVQISEKNYKLVSSQEFARIFCDEGPEKALEIIRNYISRGILSSGILSAYLDTAGENILPDKMASWFGFRQRIKEDANSDGLEFERHNFRKVDRNILKIARPAKTNSSAERIRQILGADLQALRDFELLYNQNYYIDDLFPLLEELASVPGIKNIIKQLAMAGLNKRKGNAIGLISELYHMQQLRRDGYEIISVSFVVKVPGSLSAEGGRKHAVEIDILAQKSGQFYFVEAKHNVDLKEKNIILFNIESGINALAQALIENGVSPQDVMQLRQQLMTKKSTLIYSHSSERGNMPRRVPRVRSGLEAIGWNFELIIREFNPLEYINLETDVADEENLYTGQIIQGYGDDELLEIAGSIRENSLSVASLNTDMVYLAQERAKRILERESDIRAMLVKGNISQVQIDKVINILNDLNAHFSWFNAQVESSQRFFLGSEDLLAVDLIHYLESQESRRSLPDDLVDEYIFHEVLENTELSHYQIIELTQNFFHRPPSSWIVATTQQDKARTILGRVLRGFLSRDEMFKMIRFYRHEMRNALSRIDPIVLMVSGETLITVNKEVAQFIQAYQAAKTRFNDLDKSFILPEGSVDYAHNFVENYRRQLEDSFEDMVKASGIIIQAAESLVWEGEPLGNLNQRLSRYREIFDRAVSFGRGLRQQIFENRYNPVLMDLVDSASGLIAGNELEAKKRGIKITVEQADDFSSSLVFVDPLALQVIMGILLNNASDAVVAALHRGDISEGQIGIRFGYIERQGKRWVCLGIKDNGGGIPLSSEEIERVFKRGFSTKELTEQSAEIGIKGGQGDGLAIAREYAERNGGTITIKNERGKGFGAEFIVAFPIVEVIDVVTQVHAGKPAVISSQNEVLTGPAGGKVIFNSSLTQRQISQLQSGGRVALDPKGKVVLRALPKWFKIDTSFTEIDRIFLDVLLGDSLLSRIEDAARKKNGDPVYVLDWGAGDLTAVIDLARLLKDKGINAYIIAFADAYYPQKIKDLPDNVLFIVDLAENLADRIKKVLPVNTKIDVAYSNLGLTYLLSSGGEDYFIDRLSELSDLISDQGFLTCNITMPERVRLLGNIALSIERRTGRRFRVGKIRTTLDVSMFLGKKGTALAANLVGLTASAEGGMARREDVDRWISEGKKGLPMLTAHILRGLSGQPESVIDEEIRRIYNALRPQKLEKEFLVRLKAKGFIVSKVLADSLSVIPVFEQKIEIVEKIKIGGSISSAESRSLFLEIFDDPGILTLELFSALNSNKAALNAINDVIKTYADELFHFNPNFKQLYRNNINDNARVLIFILMLEGSTLEEIELRLKGYQRDILDQSSHSYETADQTIRNFLKGYDKANGPESNDVIITAMTFVSLCNQLKNSPSNAEGGMARREDVDRWISEGNIGSLIAHITRGMQGQPQENVNREIERIYYGLNNKTKELFVEALRIKGIVVPIILNVDTSPSVKAISPVESGLMLKMYADYDMEVKKVVNPGDEDISAVYFGAGMNISDFLLSTNATNGYFVARYGGLLPFDLVNCLRNPGLFRHNSRLESYLNSRAKKGYIVTPIVEDVNMSLSVLVAELDAMGVDLNTISVDSDGGSPRIRFKWKYFGTSEEKTYSITFIDVEDVTVVQKYPQRLRDVIDRGFDIFYLKAGHSIVWDYQNGKDSFMHEINKGLKPGGYFVTDDYTLDHSGRVTRYDLSGKFPLSEVELIDNDELNNLYHEILQENGIVQESDPEQVAKVSYGWHLRIRHKLSASALTPGGIDFRSLPIVNQAMTNLKANNNVLTQIKLASVNLSTEWNQIEKMADSGITPSTQRIKEYLQASSLKGSVIKDKNKVISCISNILRKQEEECCVTEPELRDILVVLESSNSAQDLKRAFVGG